MRRSILAGFLLLLAIDTATQVSAKLAGDRVAKAAAASGWLESVVAEPMVLLVIGGYLAAFVTYVTLLKHAPIGPAFAAAHLHIVTVLIVSMVAFGDRLSLIQVAGSLLILGGVLILAATEKEVPPPAPRERGEDPRSG